MSKENIKNVFEMLFDSLSQAERQETEEEYGDKIRTIIEKEKDILKDMEDFNMLINFKVDDILNMIIEKLNSDVDRDNLYKIQFIYKEYSFIEQHLQYLVKQNEGFACCADKSRWLMEVYKEYILIGTIPDMTRGDKCYWKPRFGTGEQWMKLCDSLIDFHCGDPTNYLLSMKNLIEEVKEIKENGRP